MGYLLGIDLSPNTIELAAERLPDDLAGTVDFRAGDMLDAAHGTFDHVAAMDSIIHYDSRDIADVLAGLAARTRHSIVFTFAPRTALLTAMWSVGRLFPRGDRAPMIEPIREAAIRRIVATDPRLKGWAPGRTRRINSGFYISHGMELVRT